MSRRDRQRLEDIRNACEAIGEYLAASDVDDGLVFDAVRMRLVEIGEAVKDLPSAMRDREPTIAWSEIARMRDSLTHRYFDASHAIVNHTAQTDVPMLLTAIDRLLASVD